MVIVTGMTVVLSGYDTERDRDDDGGAAERVVIMEVKMHEKEERR